MNFRTTMIAMAATLTLSGSPALAATFTMQFEGIPVSDIQDATTPSVNYTEHGMTMDPVGHYDAYRNHPVLSPDPTNRNPVIHEGNTGSRVDFTYSGGAFDLLSLDVIGWLFNGATPNYSTTVTFASSTGGSHAINATTAGPNFTGPVDFTALSGFNDILSFSIFLPNPGTNCGLSTSDCPNFAFDNLTFRAPPVSAVPIPATLPLLAGGLGLLGLLGRRRQRLAAAA